MRETDKPAKVFHADLSRAEGDSVYTGVYFPVCWAKTELCRAHWLYAEFVLRHKEDQPNDRSPPAGK